MESPDHERRHVVEYMGGQAPDETVEHAEKIAAERLLGDEYCVWDVHTDKARWWVVKPLTNLYSQERFKSMDETLSFHIGLMLRIQEGQAGKAPDRPEPRLERTRRQWEQAARAQVEADEAEEFQAVAVRCRETLLSFAHAMGTDAIMPAGDTPPAASDFIHWSARIADAVAPGRSAKPLRSYLKAVSTEAWQYVSSLAHDKNAARADGDLAVQMVAHVLSLFEQAIERTERGGPERCPSCSSYRLVRDEEYDPDSHAMINRRLCEACEWSEEYEPTPLGPPSPLPPPPEGDCIVG